MLKPGCLPLKRKSETVTQMDRHYFPATLGLFWLFSMRSQSQVQKTKTTLQDSKTTLQEFASEMQKLIAVAFIDLLVGNKVGLTIK